MAVIAIFKYQIKPGRLSDFMKKLAEAADEKFASPTMPKSMHLFRSTVPGPDTQIILMLEYEDMAAYGARTAFESANGEWRRLSRVQAGVRRRPLQANDRAAATTYSLPRPVSIR